MKRDLVKFACTALAAAMVFSCASMYCVPNTAVTAVQAADTYITESGGWFESAYAKWATVHDATGFAAYIKGASEADSAFKRIDNELIRKYPTYFRVDAVGLKAGDYVIKVVPLINDKLDESKAFTTGTLNVESYDRSGFSFSGDSLYKTASGAYNDDGTLKSNAKVLYVTKDTAKTVSADIITDNKGKTTKCTGIQSIIDAKQKGLDTTPLDFRIIGQISKDDLDHISSSAEGLQVKGKGKYSEMNITIEGIGDDATVSGFGFLLRNCGNVELRNFAILNFMDDGVSIDTDNQNLWVHNMEFFYGGTGGDSDQAKGDGTVDIKGNSKYVTVSYNHFYDSGKSSLCGMTGESAPNYITYHHNWFDHSDSRHPRIRVMSVHIYNNYYDGNSKYGVGAAKNSSAFVESNYFENCKHPMLSSKQGSDIMVNEKTGAPDFSAQGTFSGEEGGIIKAYNNHVAGADENEFGGGSEPVYYNASDTKTNGAATQFDAYLASSRTETVPATVKALSGGTVYDNFDTKVDLGVDAADITPVDKVPEVVKAGAGRINGGDFFRTTGSSRNDFKGLTDSTDYDVDTALKSKIVGYTSSLVSVGGMESGGEVDSTESTETTTEGETKEPVSEETTVGLVALEEGTYAAADIVANENVDKFKIDNNKASTAGQLKIDTGSVIFAVKDGAHVVINYKCGSSDSSKSASISCAGQTGKMLAGSKGDNPVTDALTLDLKAGEYKITAAQSGGTQAQIISIIVTYGGVPGPDPGPNPNPNPDPDPAAADGDADGSGKVTSNDAAIVFKYAMTNNSTAAALEKCDVDGDGKITASDASQVLSKAVDEKYVYTSAK